MRRSTDGWGAVECIEALSSPGNEWFPNQTRDGTLYFGSERRSGNLGPEGTADLWRARRLGDRFEEPENLGPVINTPGQDIEPWIASDESYLVFASKGRPDSLGSYDFYVSFRCRGGWTEPRPLGEGANSPRWDFGGRFSPDGATFFFTSYRIREPIAEAETLRGRCGYRQLLGRLRSSGNGLFDIYSVATVALGLATPCPSGSPEAASRAPDTPPRPIPQQGVETLMRFPQRIQ